MHLVVGDVVVIVAVREQEQATRVRLRHDILDTVSKPGRLRHHALSQAGRHVRLLLSCSEGWLHAGDTLTTTLGGNAVRRQDPEGLQDAIGACLQL